jgi:hypothetical protein
MLYILRNTQIKSFFFIPYAIKILEFKTYKTLILSIYLYEFKTRNFTFSKIHKMNVYEKENIYRIYNSTIQFFHNSIREFQLTSHSITEKTYLSPMFLDQNKCLIKNFRRSLLLQAEQRRLEYPR